MTKTLTELIDTAYNIKVYFQIAHYALYQYEDGSYVDFQVKKVTDLKKLTSLAGGLELKFFAGENFIIIRLFERDCY